MGDERELKYSLEDPDAVIAWLDERLPPAPGYGWRTADMTDAYFDTADRALASAGYGARLRRHGTRRTVGLKSDVTTDGALVTRNEIEAEATAALDPAAWPPSEARDLVRTLTGGQPLVARFVLRQRRRRRDYGGLELSVDEVAIRRRRELVGRLTELEVEYKSGRRSELERVRRLLARCNLVKPEPRSKMAQAALLVEGAAPVYRGDALAEAGRKVLGRLLERLVEREETLRGGDTLALKQMRVTTRRMRAAWRSFGGGYRRREVRRYVGELRAIAQLLGAVRDLDVLLEKLPADEGLDGLRAAWQGRRETAWQALVGALDASAYRRFVADYRDFVGTPGLAGSRRGRATRVMDAAASHVWEAYEQVRAATPRPAVPVAPAELHAVRIAARQFRYTLEAYRDLLDPVATERLMQRLVRLQDAVGALNDADVAARETHSWLSAQPLPQPEVAAYAANLEAEVARMATAVGPAARGVVGVTFRRLLGRAVSTV